MSNRSDRLLESITSKLKTDSRVFAAWLSGSRGRGTADEFSDIDIWVAIEDSVIADVVEDPLSFVNEYCSTVLEVIAPQNGAEDGTFILTWVQDEDIFQQVDWYFVPANTATRSIDTSTLIGDVPINVEVSPVTLTEDESRGLVIANLRIALQEINNLVKHTKRGNYWKMFNSARNADNYLVKTEYFFLHAMAPDFDSAKKSFLPNSLVPDYQGVRLMAISLLDSVTEIAIKSGNIEICGPAINAMRKVTENWREPTDCGMIPPPER